MSLGLPVPILAAATRAGLRTLIQTGARRGRIESPSRHTISLDFVAESAPEDGREAIAGDEVGREGLEPHRSGDKLRRVATTTVLPWRPRR
jgi:hypothetical protein